MEDSLAHLRNVVAQVTPLTEPAWADFKSLWHPVELERGAYFVEEGQRPHRLGFVTGGVIRAFYRTSEGEEYNKTFFTVGTFVCALAALVRGTESYINLQALEDTSLLVADYRAFTALYDRYHSVERLGRRVIEEEWIKKEHREIRFVLCSAEERYAHFQEEHPDLEHRIAQYHIASYLGITPVALSRIRGRIVHKGESDRRKIPF